MHVTGANPGASILSSLNQAGTRKAVPVPAHGEGNESGAKEAGESRSVQASEGETGQRVNTYA